VATKLSVDNPLDPRYAVQFVEGYHLAVHVGAALVLFGAVLSVTLVREVRHPEPSGAVEPAVGA
jgi:hypothetical protein